MGYPFSVHEYEPIFKLGLKNDTNGQFTNSVSIETHSYNNNIYTLDRSMSYD